MAKNEATECTAQKKNANNSRTQQRMLKWCGARIASIFGKVSAEVILASFTKDWLERNTIRSVPTEKGKDDET